MGRPKGVKNKPKAGKLIVKEAVLHEHIKIMPPQTVLTDSQKKEEMNHVKDKKEEIKEVKKEHVLSHKPILEPLQAGQAYFEAPDGHIIIGDDSKNEVWYRQGNGGKGCFINKKR